MEKSIKSSRSFQVASSTGHATNHQTGLDHTRAPAIAPDSDVSVMNHICLLAINLEHISS